VLRPPILAGVLLAASVPILRRAGGGPGGREVPGPLGGQLVAAHAVKLAAGLVTMQVLETFYKPGADAHDYHLAGLQIAPYLRAGRLGPAVTLARTVPFDTRIRPPVSTNFVRLFTGGVYAVCGPSRTDACLVFSSVGFWGVWCFHRAFALAVAGGRPRAYARLAFGWPSILFWTSSIGKEPWMALGLGMGALGWAHLIGGRRRRGLAVGGAGAGVTLLVRPHIASYLGFRPAPQLTGEAGSGGAPAGSWFSPPKLRSVRDLPTVAASVLFRPHLGEAGNAAGLAAALEGTGLLVLSAARAPRIAAALAGAHRQPYVWFIVGALGGCVAALSPLANFGLLVRERSPILPLYLMLLCTGPTRRAAPATPSHSPDHQTSFGTLA
jgi:hypothetical protein